MDATRTSNHPKIMDKLFRGLVIQYPSFCKGLSKEDTEATKRFWGITLKGFSDERIIETMMNCPTTFPERCPKVGEFKKACNRNQAHKHGPSMLRIGHIPNNEKGRAELDKMHEWLKEHRITSKGENDDR